MDLGYLRGQILGLSFCASQLIISDEHEGRKRPPKYCTPLTKLPRLLSRTGKSAIGWSALADRTRSQDHGLLIIISCAAPSQKQTG
jgi:hypothetical protein